MHVGVRFSKFKYIRSSLSGPEYSDSGLREESINPYAATQAVDNFVPVGGAEAIRKAHISHEASVKSIGILYFLGAVIIIPIGLISTFFAFTLPFASNDAAARDPLALPIMIGIGVFYLAIGIVQLMTAFGLRRLQPWARIVSIVLSCIGLLGFPIGTVISVYFLYLLLSSKGQYVFSEEYKAIIAETPHVKYRTSIVVWLLLAILVLILISLIAFISIGP